MAHNGEFLFFHYKKKIRRQAAPCSYYNGMVMNESESGDDAEQEYLVCFCQWCVMKAPEGFKVETWWILVSIIWAICTSKHMLSKVLITNMTFKLWLEFGKTRIMVFKCITLKPSMLENFQCDIRVQRPRKHMFRYKYVWNLSLLKWRIFNFKAIWCRYYTSLARKNQIFLFTMTVSFQNIQKI